MTIRKMGSKDLSASFSSRHDSHRLLREDDFVSWITDREGLGHGSVGYPTIVNDAADKFRGIDSLKTTVPSGTYEIVEVRKRLGKFG